MAKQSIKIFTGFGIPVYVHFSFILIFLYLAYITQRDTFWVSGVDWIGLAGATGFVLALFFCVILHEYGHALTARRFGFQTQDIILYPIGGVARLKGMPSNPWQEFLVAIAGPAVNVAIAAVLFIPSVFLSGYQRSQLMQWALNQENAFVYGIETWHIFLFLLFFMNLVLCVFNLIPAFPMDGGRILRAGLSHFLGRGRATRIASRIGQVIAVGFAIAGIMQQDYMLVLLAIFVVYAAARENQSVVWEETIKQTSVSNLPLNTYTLSDSISVGSVREALGQITNPVSAMMVTNSWGDITGKLVFADIMGHDIPLEAPVSNYTKPYDKAYGYQETVGDITGQLHTPAPYLHPVFDGMDYKGAFTIEDIWSHASILMDEKKKRKRA